MHRIFYIYVLLSLMLFASVNTQAQDMSWWNNKHQWDGVTPWFRMMTTSAAYMGPNALPVPEIGEGLAYENASFEMRPQAHLSKGDQTYDLYTSIKVPFGKYGSFEAFLVPVEYYKMDTFTRDERMARNYDAKGFAGGDFWFGTTVNVLHGQDRLPDVSMAFYFKTASGTQLDDARYTDAPAYYILVNAGKDLLYFGKNEELKLRVFGSLGTYIWQTHSDIHNQDDAWLYGLGVSVQDKYRFARLVYAGYNGYINNGDRPMVLRMQFGTRPAKMSSNRKMYWSFRYEIGLQDFDYHTIGLGLTYVFY